MNAEPYRLNRCVAFLDQNQAKPDAIVVSPALRDPRVDELLIVRGEVAPRARRPRKHKGARKELILHQPAVIQTRNSVSFSLDENGSVCSRSFHYDQHRSAEEKGECWMSADDFYDIRCDCRQAVHQAEGSTYSENLMVIYEACKEGNPKRFVKERAAISAAQFRGLESLVVPSVQRERRNLVVTILKTQEALPVAMPSHHREEVMAKSSNFLSKRSRLFARILAAGDVAVVAAYERLDAIKETNRMDRQPVTST